MAEANVMTSKPRSSSWKLHDTVKIMKINVSKAYRKSHSLQSEMAMELTHPREIKKWTKKDIYLFSYEVPVIKYCPKNADISDMSSSTCGTVQLDNVGLVKHISKFSKPNVLAINFPTFSLLLSFKTRVRLENWMSELLCLTDIYTLLLHKTSNTSVKLGYYQLRFVLNKVLVYDTITKKRAWTWNVSHICGYSKIKSSEISIEIGRESPVDGYFSFTGKQIGVFCAQLQMLGQKIAQKSCTLPPYKFCQSAAAVSSEDLSSLSKTAKKFHTFQFVRHPHNQCLSVPSNLNTSHLLDPLSLSSVNFSANSNNSMTAASSDETLLWPTSAYNLKQATVQSSHSFNDLDKFFDSSDEENDEYVIPTLTSSTSENDYLTILPDLINDYDELTELHENIYSEIDTLAVIT